MALTPQSHKEFIPLFEAATNGNINEFQIVEDENRYSHIDLNMKDKYGWTLLHHASHRGNLSVAKYLVENGASRECLDKKGKSPYDVTNIGCLKGYLMPAAVLATGLFDAAINGNIDELRLYYSRRKNIDSNIKDMHGWTLLHHASQGGHIIVADFVIEKGADISAITKNG